MSVNPCFYKAREVVMKLMTSFFLFAVLWFGVCIQTSEAQSLPARPAKYTPVNDFTGTLTPTEIQTISKKLIDFETQQSTQIVIVMVASLGSRSVEQYSNELFKAWGIGQKGKDNGVLVFVAKNDRKIRIETGYGAEGAITDLATQQIITDILRPNFKNNAYGKGFSEAADKLMSLVVNEYSNADRVASESSDGGAVIVGLIILLFILLIIGLIIWSIFRAIRNATQNGVSRRGYRQSQDSGGVVVVQEPFFAPTYFPPTYTYSSNSSNDDSSSSDNSWSSSSSDSSSSSSDWGGGESGGGGSSGDW
jgi:uncharacterized protein